MNKSQQILSFLRYDQYLEEGIFSTNANKNILHLSDLNIKNPTIFLISFQFYSIFSFVFNRKTHLQILIN